VISPAPVIITLAILVAAWIGMYASWRRRKRRQGAITQGVAPTEFGTPALSVDGLYLATTFAGRPLDRVVAGDLGFRARATVTVTDLGVLLDRDGAQPIFVPKQEVAGAGVATWTIDRAVERNGLTVLGWAMHDGGAASVPVESSFRIDIEPRAELIAAVSDLVGSAGDHPGSAHVDQ
jgi:hypothetical protein